MQWSAAKRIIALKMHQAECIKSFKMTQSLSELKQAHKLVSSQLQSLAAVLIE